MLCKILEGVQRTMRHLWIPLLLLLIGCTSVEVSPIPTNSDIQTKNSMIQLKRSLQIQTSIQEQLDQPQNHWELVWVDDFSNPSSLKRWDIQDWASEKNGEWQYYAPENVSIVDGHLVIVSKKERYRGKHYTSGALTTEGLFEFTYGKVEIRAKLPKGQGMFPALWLITNNNGTWLPEIDIMENLGHKPNEIYQVVHWRDEEGKQRRDYYHHVDSEKDFSENFHVYGLIWEEERLIWTLDDDVIFETEVFSPDVPLYIYINAAVGGYWPGPPDPNESSYPKYMYVDYVKVYQKGKEGEGT